MSAGVGKSYRMLQEAHALLRNGIDVKIGFIETHQRQETQAYLTDYLYSQAIFSKERSSKNGSPGNYHLRPEVVCR